jgi:Leucine-rich repeat (LRR) protein
MLHVPEPLRSLGQLQQLNLSGNLLENLPAWFGTAFALLELQLGDPWTGGWNEHSPAHSRLCLLGEWLSSEADENALPHTLHHLALSDIKSLTSLPRSVRHMRQLESLDIHSTECSINGEAYLAVLPLRQLVLLNTPSAPPNLPGFFSELRLDAVVLTHEDSYSHSDDEQFAISVVDNLRRAFAPRASLAASLRVLRLEDLQLEELPLGASMHPCVNT